MFVIKFVFENDLRRVAVDKPLSVKELNELACSIFRDALPTNFVLKYKDDEGDVLTITNEAEIQEALRLFKDQGILRVMVVPAMEPAKVRPQHAEEKSSPLDDFVGSVAPYLEAIENHIAAVFPKLEEQLKELYPKIEHQMENLAKEMEQKFGEVFRTKEEATVTHPAICDHCNQRIKGLRWKCQTCLDYDLCSDCKEVSAHTEGHLFEKLDKPILCTRSMDPPNPKEAQIPLHVMTPQVVKEEFKPMTPLPVVVKEEPKRAELKPLVPQKEEPKQPSEFEAKLKQLNEMGFVDRRRNIELLVKNKGDMVNVVKDLLE